MRATAFCPAHITGFFQICEHRDLLQMGSRGAGICISRGATSSVELEKGDREIRVTINGKEDRAPVTAGALKYLVEDEDLQVHVKTELQLPTAQGFGMSAAGALSASLATAELLSIPRQKAFQAAHRSEIVNKGGLGDVAALSAGGVTFRVKAGLPPRGEVRTVPGEPELMICTLDRGILTSDVLSDGGVVERINRAGGRCVRKMVADPSVENLFRLSREFAFQTGLVTPRVEECIEQLDGTGAASMVMIGNSVFSTGDLDAQETILQRLGTTYRVTTDIKGPRLMEPDR